MRALKRLQEEVQRRENGYTERGLSVGELVLGRSEALTKFHPC